MKLILDGLESKQWVTQIGSTINSVPAQAFVATPIFSGPTAGLRITNYSTVTNGGGLVTLKFTDPSILGVIAEAPYGGFDFDFFWRDEDAALISRLEFDTKISRVAAGSTPIANTDDLSAQLNGSEGGMLQIDNGSQQWADTGIKPGMPPVNQWTHFSIRYFRDLANGKFSVSSASIGGVSGQVPSTMQGLPLLTSNWAAVLALQFQTELYAPGVASFIVRNVTATYADETF